MRFKESQRTIQEWELLIGEQIRAVRIASDLDQSALAVLASISVGAVSNLERGRGSSLHTVLAVVRALGRTDWLEALAPPVTISPIQMLRTQRPLPRRRVRAKLSGGHDSPPR